MRNILIFVLILSLFLIPNLSAVLTKTYNFNSTFEGVNSFAKDCTATTSSNLPPSNDIPPGCFGTLSSLTSNNGLDSSDDVKANTNGGASGYPLYQMFYFYLSENKSDINSLNFTWEGKDDSSGNMYFYKWNITSSSWLQNDTFTTIADVVKNYYDDSPSYLINDSNYVNLLILFDAPALADIDTDFVQLGITYTPTVTVNLSSPNDLISSNSLLNNFVCNSSVSSGDTLNGVNLTIWNNDGTVNGSNYTVISGTTNSTNSSYTFLSDGTYKWNCNVNSTSGSSAYASSNRTITISTDAPAITLDYPSNNTYFNTNNNIYLNYTATDSNGLSTCEVWGDWKGTWHKNSTNLGVVSGSQNFTIINTSSDNVYKWNVWCNDTTNSAQFSTNNFTFTTDTINPTILLENITSTAGSQTFTFDVLATDTNLNNCFYTIYNSTGDVDSATTANTSVSCTANDKSATVSDFGVYNLFLYSNDSAGNLNVTSDSFTISTAPTTTQGGGGGGENIVPVIVLKQLNSGTLTISPIGLSELQRAILYRSIRETCLNNSKIDNCLLTNDKKNELIINLQSEGITLTLEELNAYLDLFNKGEVEEIKISESIADTYNLFKSTLQVIESSFTVSPSKLTPFFLVTSKNSEFKYEIKSNKVLKSVNLINGELGFSVELTSSTTALVTYKIQSLDFSAKTYKATINYIAEDGSSVFQEVEIRAIYIFNQNVLIVVFSIVVGLIIISLIRSKQIKNPFR